MIEALGVPHTEVELVLVNGESSDFGRLLADRSLSRLMHDDWPRTLDELERKRRG